MIKFEFDTDIPDVNYYTPSEIEPVVEGTKIIFYNGKGRSRHWGRPEITTEVIYKDKNFLSAVILYRTKYSAGRFYRHYLLYNRKILKIEWKQVPMRYQSKVLEACEDKYIVPPGKIHEKVMYVAVTEDHPVLELCLAEKYTIYSGEFVGVRRRAKKDIKKLLELYLYEDMVNLDRYHIVKGEPINVETMENGLKFTDLFVPLSVEGPLFLYLDITNHNKLIKGRSI